MITNVIRPGFLTEINFNLFIFQYSDIIHPGRRYLATGTVANFCVFIKLLQRSSFSPALENKKKIVKKIIRSNKFVKYTTKYILLVK